MALALRKSVVYFQSFESFERLKMQLLELAMMKRQQL